MPSGKPHVAHSLAFGLMLWLLDSSAQAQQLALTRFRGAGGDPRTSIAQPETTSQASGGYVSSVEPYLGPFGDPLGIRPVLKEQGIDLELLNWRSVVAPPGLTPEQTKALIDTVEKMAKSKADLDEIVRKGQEQLKILMGGRTGPRRGGPVNWR